MFLFLSVLGTSVSTSQHRGGTWDVPSNLYSPAPPVWSGTFPLLQGAKCTFRKVPSGVGSETASVYCLSVLFWSGSFTDAGLFHPYPKVSWFRYYNPFGGSGFHRSFDSKCVSSTSLSRTNWRICGDKNNKGSFPTRVICFVLRNTV